tara:strand:- start:396 stop:1175 length:780 start_codon:yes stop_codon:yes gene_type:complete
MLFATGGDERLRINSSGNLLVSNSTMSSSGSHENNVPLCINGDTNKITLMLGDASTSVSGHGVNDYSGDIRFNGANVAWGDITYYPNGNGAGGAFRFTGNGSTVASQGNRSIGCSGVFISGTTENQHLDDYEEGIATFQLHINGSEASGVSYSYNTAPYVKVGRMVYCAVSMFATNLPTTTGPVDIQGLPFTDGGGGGYREPAYLAANHGGAGTYVISGALHGNNTKIRIRKNGNQDLDGSDFGGTFWMHGHITYKANV